MSSATTSVPESAVVVGAGTMGPGIAVMMARAGCRVHLVDVAPPILERARGVAAAAVESLRQVGELDEGQGAAILGRIRYAASLEEAVQAADFVLEAVPEKLEIKREVFAKLEAAAPERAILASNTSGIPITRLQEGRARPERIVGMHWSNQPHVIPVIEVIRGERTAEQTVDATHAFIRAMGHVPVTVRRDIAGFVENRILYATIREALYLLEQGIASAEDIDTIVRYGIGMKLAVVGPLALLDVAGLDIYHAVASYLNKDLSSSAEVSSLIREHVEKGQLGLKTGRGLFEYVREQIPALMQQRNGTMLRLKQELMRGEAPEAHRVR